MSPVKGFFIFYFTTARGFSNNITVLPLTSLLEKGEGELQENVWGGSRSARNLKITNELGFAKYQSTSQHHVFQTESCLDQELKIQNYQFYHYHWLSQQNQE